MPRRHPSSWAQQVAPEGLPGGGDRRRRARLPPALFLPELRAAPGAGASGSTRASEGGAEWWQALGCDSSRSDPSVRARRRRLRLPVLPTVVAQRAARTRSGLRSLLLPPLLLAGEPREPAPPRPGPPRWEDPFSGSASETPDSLGSLLREFLPSGFRQFLRQLLAECACAEPPPPPPRSSASQHQRSVSEHSGRSQCPSHSFLPDLRGQSSYFKNSLKKILLHQIPALGPLSRDHSQFTKVKEANLRPHATQAPKLKAVLTPSSSGEGSGHRRRCCPFRVRFTDETLRDTALRYWERGCAVRQGTTENGTAGRSAASERVFGSVGRWLESLPKALYPRAKETRASSLGWDVPGLPTLEPKGWPSEDTSASSRLSYLPRAATQRQQGDLKTFLEQVGKSPCSWTQKLSFLPSLVLHMVLRRGRPKGYQLLPSTAHGARR